jgi:integrase
VLSSHVRFEGGRPVGSDAVLFITDQSCCSPAERGLVALTCEPVRGPPASRVKTPNTERRAIRILSVKEVEALADAFDARYRALVLLGAYAGLRFGEVSALRTPHLRLLERRIEISEGASEVNGKLYAPG